MSAQPFIRTVSGIRAYHRFKKVSLVVYSEGKTPDDEKGSGIRSGDTIFWRIIFKKVLGKDVKVISTGSKTKLLAIIERLKEKRIDTVCFAMDRDYDDFTGKIINDRVVYTYGYSWENDLWNIETARLTIERMARSKCTISNEQVQALGTLMKKSSSAMKVEMYNRIICGHGVLPKTRTCSGVITFSNKKPHINKDRVKSLILKNAVCKCVNGIGTVFLFKKHCYGHFFSTIFSCWTSWILNKQYTHKNVDRWHIENIAFISFEEWFSGSNCPTLFNYYRASIGSIFP